MNLPRSLFATENKISKFFIDPAVDEEVSKVVDEDKVEEIGGQGQTRIFSQNKRKVRYYGQKE